MLAVSSEDLLEQQSIRKIYRYEALTQEDLRAHLDRLTVTGAAKMPIEHN